MNKTEIYEMAMQEMIEENLRLRRKSCTEQEKKQYENVSALAEQVQDILKKQQKNQRHSRKGQERNKCDQRGLSCYKLQDVRIG